MYIEDIASDYELFGDLVRLQFRVWPQTLADDFCVPLRVQRKRQRARLESQHMHIRTQLKLLVSRVFLQSKVFAHGSAASELNWLLVKSTRVEKHLS